ncbi:uncharacterized protein A4U43_C09F8780 [Asparagus officinalis]|uniref:Aminotransferase-like plant mobile domain-containing protein n=1 Tax=Asparagus officinalis TaxID=4686 RepID=A0A5P1E9I5_ASPOF|nr:uncharacterized protein A4U43_C09F8780 [Asparagus officinalis]
MPDRYETLWDLTCHYHIALAQSEPLTKRTKSNVSLKQFTSYLFRNLESNSGESICELAPLTSSGVNSLLKKIDAHSYTISSAESGFPAGTKFKSFLWHATAPTRPMTLLVGYLAIWLKKCVVPYQSSDALPLEVLYPAVQLAYKKELSLLPLMVANIHQGLRQISSAFTRKESESPTQIPTIKLLENGKWEGRGFPDIRRPGYLTFRVGNQCFIELYLPCRFPRQFGYDQLYVGNPRQQLRTHGGLVDGLRAWLWTVTGCTGAKFSLQSAERQLNLTFLSFRWLLAANKTVPVKPIEELVAEEASQIDSRVIRDGAQSQRVRGKTRRIDAEGNKAFSSAGEASGGDPEDYEEDFERGTATDSEEEFRPFTRARPSTVAPAARRKKLVRKPRADPRASDMDLASDDSARDGGEREEGEMSLDPAPHDFVSSGEPDSPYQVEKPAEAADVREAINVGLDSMNPDKLQEANMDFGSEEADAPVGDFLTEDFDGEGLFVDTLMLHFMYDSPQIDDLMPEDMFPESALPQNPENGSFEGTCLFSS